MVWAVRRCHDDCFPCRRTVSSDRATEVPRGALTLDRLGTIRRTGSSSSGVGYRARGFAFDADTCRVAFSRPAGAEHDMGGTDLGTGPGILSLLRSAQG